MPLPSGDALGEFMDDIAIHKGGALNYRGEIGNRSWKRDAVATLVHEMGYKEEDPLRVALFLKFANPNYYQAVSKEFENQIRSEHPEGKVPSLDKILHVDLLRDVSKK